MDLKYGMAINKVGKLYTLLYTIMFLYNCLIMGVLKYELFLKYKEDKRININQDWLDRYELETYLHVKVITLGYKIKEVAVSKNYLPSINNYSKMRPFIDWWKLSRPVFLLKFGFKS